MPHIEKHEVSKYLIQKGDNMARTFLQPDKKETPTQKLKRELKEAEAQRDSYQKEASSLRQQINAKLEETDAYNNLVKQLTDMTLQRNMANRQRDRYKAKVTELEEELAKLRGTEAAADTVAELQRQLADRDNELKALRSDYEALREQLQNVNIGRPLAYTDQIDKIMKMREGGQSIRAIAKVLGIPSATVARYAKMYQNK